MKGTLSFNCSRLRLRRDAMFERGYYSVANGHANTMPMITLLEVGGTRYYGLYRLLFEVTLLSDGEITRRNFDFLCLTKGKLELDGEIDDFLKVCTEQGLVRSLDSDDGCGDEVRLYLPEVKDYLRFVEEKDRQRKESQRKGGINSAQKRADNQGCNQLL